MIILKDISKLKKNYFPSYSQIISSVSKDFACSAEDLGVRFLGWEDSLEKEMATHSSILAWKISWTEDPGGL